jgi:hypothetical protein
MTANKKTQLFEPRHLSKTTFPLQPSYGNPLSFRVHRTSLLSGIIDPRVWIRSNHSFLNLSRYCRNFIRPDTMFMRVPTQSRTIQVYAWPNWKSEQTKMRVAMSSIVEVECLSVFMCLSLNEGFDSSTHKAFYSRWIWTRDSMLPLRIPNG